jgi:hypothetical protein
VKLEELGVPFGVFMDLLEEELKNIENLAPSEISNAIEMDNNVAVLAAMDKLNLLSGHQADAYKSHLIGITNILISFI